MAKPKSKKRTKCMDYAKVLKKLEEIIPEVGRLSTLARANGDMIASWMMATVYEDLCVNHRRIGNIRLTIKGDQS